MKVGRFCPRAFNTKSLQSESFDKKLPSMLTLDEPSKAPCFLPPKSDKF